MAGLTTLGARPVTPANRLGLDYRVEAKGLRAFAPGIIDFHAHTNGRGACGVFREVMDLFGVTHVFTQVPLPEAPVVRDVLGDRVRFIAFPNFRQPDRHRAMGEGFLADIAEFHGKFGARILKLWNAPRMRELFPGEQGKDLVEFDSEWRIRQAELGERLGMMFMVHVADPDTWFRTRYADATRFGAKIDHYRGLRVMLDRFKGPWVAAHMGGWPEDLGFLDSLLASHQNLYLDTSATKWIVRELSAQPAPRAVEFFEKWRERIVFGSDIVTTDEHLAARPAQAGGVRHPMADLAETPEGAFELYASRYFALRTILETGYRGPGFIADPDLHMVDPARAPGDDTPLYRGLSLPGVVLRGVYRESVLGMLARAGITLEQVGQGVGGASSVSPTRRV